ncbi:MAG: RDD family protein [Silanimonas sp.]
MENALWYYVNADRQRQGPVPTSTIRELAAAGTLNARTLVWRQGMPQWQALEQVAAGLGVTLASTPLAAPPSPPPASRVDDAAPTAARSTAFDPDATRVLRAEPRLAEMPGAQGLSEPKRAEPIAAYPDAAVQQAYAAQVGADPQARRTLHGDGHVVYAGFWKRFAANFIDSFLVGMVGGVIGGIIGALFGLAMLGGGADPLTGSMLSNGLNFVIGIVLGLLYYGGFHSSSSQATPGKLLIGIKVARGDGDRLTPVRAGARFLATYINIFTLGIGWLLAAFTERKQALHDFICDTIVVDRWAYTEFPERQTEALGGCAIAVLVIAGLLILGTIVATIALMAALGSGGWN